VASDVNRAYAAGHESCRSRKGSGRQQADAADTVAARTAISELDAKADDEAAEEGHRCAQRTRLGQGGTGYGMGEQPAAEESCEEQPPPEDRRGIGEGSPGDAADAGNAPGEE